MRVFGYVFFLLAFCSVHLSAAEFCFEETCFQVELASSPAALERGLMYRTSLDQNEGMLFVFDQAMPWSFWMKNTLIPLDIIWMDAAFRVVHIEENVLPCMSTPCPQYAPKEPAIYVLEVTAGTVSENALEVGEFGVLYD